MSSVSTVTTFVDLYTDLMNRIRADTSQSSTSGQAKRYVNVALQDMHLGTGEKFHWAERQGMLRTQPKYETGTVTITKGSTTLTGSGTAWNTNNDFSVANVRVGGKIVINGGKEVYRVSAVGSDTSITLETSFIQDDVSGASYSYYEDEYALATDFLKPLDIRSFDINGEVEIISRTVFRRLWVQNKTTNKPRVATFMNRGFDSDTVYQRRVRFHPPPDKAYLFPYSYVTSYLAVASDGTTQENLVNDTDEPIVPLNLRHAIVYHALKNWYRDKKNDPRSREAAAEYDSIMSRIVSDNEIGNPRPSFQPRLGHYASAAKRPYRRGRGRHVIGSAFDERRE